MSQNNIDFKLIAAQLRKPNGDMGIEVANSMMKNNKLIVTRTYNFLQLHGQAHILEIGMANGAHVNELVTKANQIQYVGVDYSEDMVREARELNKALIQKHSITFEQSDFSTLQYPINKFTHICTANTLYFWPQPEQNMQLLFNWLQTGGQMVLGIKPKRIMEKMPVTQFNFDLYSTDKVEKLMKQAGFKNVTNTELPEPSRDVMGERYEISGQYFIGWKE